MEATRQQLAAILEERREQYAQADLTVPLGDQEGSPLGAPVSVVAFRRAPSRGPVPCSMGARCESFGMTHRTLLS